MFLKSYYKETIQINLREGKKHPVKYSTKVRIYEFAVDKIILS